MEWRTSLAAKKAKLFRDPVHGMIEVWDEELALIDTSEFQRLRRIRQLALTNYVYHGAEHTRFGHALGTMYVATEMFDAIVREFELNGQKIDDADEQRRLLRLGALLHDIGHAPFSHAAEELLFPPGNRKHEQVGAEIIRERLGGIIHEHYGPEMTERVCAMLAPNAPKDITYLSLIVSGPLDADKLDYLARDSLYCGVTYGHYDYRRLLSKLILREAPGPEGEDPHRQVVIAVGGLQAAESVFVARYWLFVQVYYHSVRRQLDHILGKFLNEEVLEGGHYPIDSVDEYLKWDDGRVLAELEKGTGPWATLLHGNRPYFKQIAEHEPKGGLEGKRNWYKLVVDEVNKQAKREVAFFDQPSVKSDLAHPMTQSEELQVEQADGTYESLRDASDLIKSLPRDENRRYAPRLFALPDWEDTTRKVYDEIAKTMEAS